MDAVNGNSFNGSAKSLGGRPSKRTPEARAKLVAAVRKGMRRSLACGLAGISCDTLQKWEKEDPTLAEELDQAKSEAVGGTLSVIQDAAKTDWKAAAWVMEWLCPEEFSTARPSTVRPAVPAHDPSLHQFIERLQSRQAVGDGVEAAPRPAAPSPPESAPRKYSF